MGIAITQKQKHYNIDIDSFLLRNATTKSACKKFSITIHKENQGYDNTSLSSSYVKYLVLQNISNNVVGLYYILFRLLYDVRVNDVRIIFKCAITF